MLRRLLWIVLAMAGGMAVPMVAGAQIDVDYAVFRYDSSQVYWEIYYTIPRSCMTYVTDTSADFSGIALVRMKLIKDGAAWKELAWKVKDTLPDTAQTRRTTKFIDRVQVLVPPGDYSVTLIAQDLHNPVYLDSVSFAAGITGFPSGKLSLSDIELASSIEKNSQEKKNPFYKNTLLVVPNPSRVFGELFPVLHFYVEAYYPLESIPKNNYRIRYLVLDANGKPREEINTVSLLRRNQMDARVEFGSVSLASLTMGTYFLHFAIDDSAGTELVSKNAKFYVYNANQIQQRQFSATDQSYAVLQSEFAGMDESDLDQDFSYAFYLSTSEEKDMYNALKEEEAKRNFLYSFWQKRDTNPSTPFNEFRQEYMRRIQHANEKYRTFNKPGWKTDRGRVYMIYGEPSYIDRNPSTEGYRPFEVWQYDEIQGGVIFVFADLSGFRDYILLHSTARGETQYPEYMERIKRGF